ncbi:unnamed protein product [Dimorphilus gyrociliatus]|uniref:Uncharacterized protein n=1 Tax=Dimorphilus gyrociliatus TaxID=2664684 RepID=A0A7I8W5C6_9ANNE|nr:unnamed protein product [Dimorphilus gyrociliatus]
MTPLIFMKLLQRRSLSDRTARKIRCGVSLISCYAAGVFLGTSILDLFPNVRGKFTKFLRSKLIDSEFPLPEFIIVIGLFLMLFIEQTVLTFREAKKHEVRALLPEVAESDQEELEYSSSSHERITPDTAIKSSIHSFMLLLALSLHSVFEGLAIGLETNKSVLFQIFAAVALHKCILAFSLGVNFIQSKLSTSAIFKSNILFCITSPVGITIGVLVNSFVSKSAEGAVVDGTLQGLAAGTFLYVIFFEIIPFEFGTQEGQPNRLLRALFLFVGYATICGIILMQKF